MKPSLFKPHFFNFNRFSKLLVSPFFNFTSILVKREYSNLTDFDIFQSLPLTPQSLFVQRFTQTGFLLAPHQVHLEGPLILFQGYALHWHTTLTSRQDVKNLIFLKHAQPKPELIIFGTGTQLLPLPETYRTFLKGIPIEVMNTRNACSTYNVLIQENRPIAACLFPLQLPATNLTTSSTSNIISSNAHQ